MKKNKIPNCLLCKWFDSIPGRVKHKSFEYITYCKAQGLKLCSNCYGSKECKKLYKEQR